LDREDSPFQFIEIKWDLIDYTFNMIGKKSRKEEKADKIPWKTLCKKRKEDSHEYRN
jgi:hypothetical protein